MAAYWTGVASRDHVLKAVVERILSAQPGKEAPLKKLRVALRSCSGPAGPLLASLKSVAAVSRFRSSDQRLISRDAGR
jgi:hypothetical protein